MHCIYWKFTKTYLNHTFKKWHVNFCVKALTCGLNYFLREIQTGQDLLIGQGIIGPSEVFDKNSTSFKILKNWDSSKIWKLKPFFYFFFKK